MISIGSMRLRLCTISSWLPPYLWSKEMAPCLAHIVPLSHVALPLIQSTRTVQMIQVFFSFTRSKKVI
jgi:hypothetical protein